jgi:hypothetical protein
MGLFMQRLAKIMELLYFELLILNFEFAFGQ